MFFRARERLHWSFPDPSIGEGDGDQQLAVYRQARDAIRNHTQLELLASMGA